MKITRKIIITNKKSLSILTCIKLVDLAKEFECDLWVGDKSISVNLKHLVELLSLVALKGTELTLTAEGDDAGKAVDAIASFLREQLIQVQ
jgi:phosphocarrier protein HPr